MWVVAAAPVIGSAPQVPPARLARFLSTLLAVPTTAEARTMHYLLLYDVTPDYLERRGDFRAEHLALAWKACERGELILGGALDDPVDLAVLLWKCDSPAPIEAFVDADPYVKNGLVARWKIRPWKTVVGESAANPVRG